MVFGGEFGDRCSKAKRLSSGLRLLAGPGRDLGSVAWSRNRASASASVTGTLAADALPAGGNDFQ